MGQNNSHKCHRKRGSRGCCCTADATAGRVLGRACLSPSPDSQEPCALPASVAFAPKSSHHRGGTGAADRTHGVQSEHRYGNTRNELSRARSAAFTPLQRTHGLGRKNGAGRWPGHRRKRPAPGALPRNSHAPVSEFGFNAQILLRGILPPLRVAGQRFDPAPFFPPPTATNARPQ